MYIAYIVIDTLALTLVVLIATSFVLSAPRTTIAWLVGLLAFNYVSYVISSRQDFGFAMPPELTLNFGAAYIVLNLARNSMSLVFMLLSHRLFREEQRFPRTLILLIFLQLFLEEPLAWILGADWGTSHPAWGYLLYEVLPACLQALFLGLAIYWALRESRFDLVSSRRAVRVVLLVLAGVLGILSLAIERIGFLGGLIPSAYMYSTHMTLVIFQVIVFAVIVFWMLRRDLLEFLLSKPSQQSTIESTNTTAADLERIVIAFEQDKIYREAGLAVADLAKHVGLPEYRLRSLIHNELGYRNFNSFLHHYRIEEIARCLEDPDQNRTPILTLALGAGYQSINPFNRAFKELKQLTPSEYRIKAQQ